LPVMKVVIVCDW